MSDNTEALQMADDLDRLGSQYDSEIAAELRRLHDLVTEDSILQRRQRDEIAQLKVLNAELSGLIQQIIDSRDKHFIDNYADGMWGWDERANAALAKVEASK